MEATPHINTPEETLAFLSPALRAVHAALDHGVSLADSLLHRLPHDAYLWSHIVRYGARCHLEAADQVGWQLGRRLPNSGIEVSWMPFVVRVLKSRNDGPPNPGHNRARASYYSQHTQRTLALDLGGVLVEGPANLILDWSVADRRTLALALSKPVGTWDFHEQRKLEWRRQIETDTDGDLRWSAPEERDIDVRAVIDPDELSESGESR